VPVIERQRKAREYARSYRARRKAMQLAAADAQLAALGADASA
jgi:hypothetical protein